MTRNTYISTDPSRIPVLVDKLILITKLRLVVPPDHGITVPDLKYHVFEGPLASVLTLSHAFGQRGDETCHIKDGVITLKIRKDIYQCLGLDGTKNGHFRNIIVRGINERVQKGFEQIRGDWTWYSISSQEPPSASLSVSSLSASITTGIISGEGTDLGTHERRVMVTRITRTCPIPNWHRILNIPSRKSERWQQWVEEQEEVMTQLAFITIDGIRDVDAYISTYSPSGPLKSRSIITISGMMSPDSTIRILEGLGCEYIALINGLSVHITIASDAMGTSIWS